MPFKRPHSPNYHVKLKLPGYGTLPETSTHVTSKATARQMEVMLRKIAEKGLEDASWYDLLDALRGGKRGQEGELTLPDLLQAHNDGTPDELRFRFKDPALSVAIEEFKATGVDYNTENGLAIVEEMVRREFGAGSRLSVLRSGKNVVKICARAEREGGRSRSKNEKGEVGWFDNSPLSRNTVVRSVRNSISKLCAFHFGGAVREQIFADVKYSAEDDAREYFLDGRQLEKLLRACESWFRPLVLTAALTGADRAPILRMRVRDVEIVHRVDLGLRIATLYLDDRKTDGRPRSVTVAGPAADALSDVVDGRDPDERVFQAWFDSSGRRLPLTRHRVRDAWERARAAAGFTIEKGWHTDLRFKDLRHTAGCAFEDVGLSGAKRQAAMGHKRAETGLKYTKRQVQLEAADAIKVARHLGILHDVDTRSANHSD